MIELRTVDAGYDSRPVLRDVDVVIGGGERVAVVGPNGAGKSTLLRLITGLLAPTRGEVLLGGQPVRELSRERIARRIAVVPQVATLPFSARVEEVVALGRLPHEEPFRGLRERDRTAVAAAIELVGLGPLAERDARELSLGERQLVLIGVAIAQQAPVILLDEPTVHLDIRHQVDVMELLRNLSRQTGTTIVAVMHDLNFAARYCERVLVLASGKIAADGAPATALTRDVVRETFRIDPDLLANPWAASEMDGGAYP